MKEEKIKIPAEAVELYSRYIHGEVSRRDFLEKVSRYAVAGLTAAAIVDRLMPNYALGQQVRKDDERIKASYETLPSPNGNGYIRGYFVRPFSQATRAAAPTKLPAVLVVHENRGLNPHTEDVARRFALENFIAFAPDALTTVGGYPNDDYNGGQLFNRIDKPKLTQDFIACAQWLKSHALSNGKVCVTGFCFGGGVSNTLATMLGPEDQLRKPGSCGRAVLNVETRVVDDQMNDVALGEVGEIVHRSPHLMLGYFHDDERTRAAFEGGWFHSGDLGTIDDEGYISVVDRKKDMIKTGGENVASREVEEAIYRMPQVSEVAVIGVSHPKWVEAVVAVVVPKAGQDLSAEEVLAHCAKQLAGFKAPKQVVFVETLPKNPSGKLLKRELRTSFADLFS